MDALDVARAAGLPIVMRGQRGWISCPAHVDQTPSLCMYPEGRFFCFSCHASGDGRALYRLIHGVEAPGQPPARRAPDAALELLHSLQQKQKRQNALLSHKRLAAQEKMDAVLSQTASWDAVWDSPVFCDALQQRTQAELMLTELDDSDVDDIVKMEVQG